MKYVFLALSGVSMALFLWLFIPVVRAWSFNEVAGRLAFDARITPLIITFTAALIFGLLTYLKHLRET